MTAAGVAAVAQSLGTQIAAGLAYQELEAAGVRSVVLKGPAIAYWLYPGEVRTSRDIDILVAPADVGRAKTALSRVGYAPWLEGVAACENGPNEEALVAPNGMIIDLHHRLIGSPGPVERCWEVLGGRTIMLPLASGVAVRVLDVPARAMHLALHAAQGGRADTKAMADLERGLACLAPEVWEAAAQVAGQLAATPAFAAGLRLTPAGTAVAARLDLPVICDVELALRIASAPQESIFLARLARTPGVTGKLGVVARKIWPTRGYLRATSTLPVDGRFWLWRARLDRQRSLLHRLGPAVRSWWRVRAALRRAEAPVSGR